MAASIFPTPLYVTGTYTWTFGYQVSFPGDYDTVVTTTDSSASFAYYRQGQGFIWPKWRLDLPACPEGYGGQCLDQAGAYAVVTVVKNLYLPLVQR
jgi:hypothetical protein